MPKIEIDQEIKDEYNEVMKKFKPKFGIDTDITVFNASKIIDKKSTGNREKNKLMNMIIYLLKK